MGGAVLIHVQAIMLLAAYYVYNAFTSKKSISRRLVEIVLPVVALAGLLYFLKEHLTSKIEFLQTGGGYRGGLLAAAKVSTFVVLAAITTTRLSVLVAGTPLILFAYVVGSERLSILAFIFLLCAATFFRKRLDFVLLPLFGYFVFKGIGFLENIFIHGSGFPT